MPNSNSNSLGEAIPALHLPDLSKCSLSCDLSRQAYRDLTAGQDQAQRIVDPRVPLIKVKQTTVVVRLSRQPTLRFGLNQIDDGGGENLAAQEV